METRIIVGLSALAALIEGLAPGAVPMELLPLALVLLGLVYGYMGVDAEDSVGVLAVVIASGLAAKADALGHIHVIGEYLDAILDQVTVALYGTAVAVLVRRVTTRIMGSS